MGSEYVDDGKGAVSEPWSNSYPRSNLYFFLELKAAQTAYLIYASDNNQNFKISTLDSNYYNVVSQKSVLSGNLHSQLATLCLSYPWFPLGSTLEAPGIVKRNGVSYPSQ